MSNSFSKVALIDYGCHAFTYRLAVRLEGEGFPIAYYANGSLESPNLSSLEGWISDHPQLVHNITCAAPYGKVSLTGRLKGEIEWAGHCIQALEQEPPSVVIASTVPLVPMLRIQAWALRRGIPFVYWLQDLQGKAIHDLLGRKFGRVGTFAGNLAYLWEQRALARSNMVITIARDHDQQLPKSVVNEGRYALLENWANIEEIPVFSTDNDWSRQHGLDQTRNVVYSGTLGLKHDLEMFYALAEALQGRADTRVVIVSSGQAADKIALEAKSRGLTNMVMLPFQASGDVPAVLGSATVLIASHARSEGTFCVPSKTLSYLCAGRPTVLAIDRENPAAKMIERAGAGIVVDAGERAAFVGAVTRLLDDAELGVGMGRAARAYAEATFSMERVVPRFLEIVEKSFSRKVRQGSQSTPREPRPGSTIPYSNNTEAQADRLDF